jgi:hypothetical protein
VLFVDIAKSWSLNEVVVRQFFPCLLPGRSVVVQQDYAFAFQPWIAITMEHLSDHFEAVAFAEYNSVVFVCTRAVGPEAADSLAGLSGVARLQLLERAIGRFRGYPRGFLETARSVLLFEQGDTSEASAQLSRVRDVYADDDRVLSSATLVGTMLGEGVS